MDNRDLNPNNNYRGDWDEPRRGGSGKVWAGLLLVVIGLVVLAAKLNYLYLPRWFFSWQMFLIGLGLFTGFKHNFRKSGWLVLVAIGTFFLLNDLIVGFNMRVYFWPLLLIGIGVWVMMKPRYKPKRLAQQRQQQPNPDADTTDQGEGFSLLGSDASSEDYVDATAIFGGIKRSIISKNFKGGEVVSVFGGTELNMSQADLQQPVVLETTQIFGGTTLVIPAHWEVKSEMVAILGGMDDKRPIMAGGYDPNKVLIIKGTSLFGGLQIKSY